MEMRIIKEPITKQQISTMAKELFGDFVKAVVDIEKEIMAIGGELHADCEALLIEKEGSKHSDVWGINLYPEESDEAFIEFNSMINLKPALGNRSRSVDDPKIREKIKTIVTKLILP